MELHFTISSTAQIHDRHSILNCLSQYLCSWNHKTAEDMASGDDWQISFMLEASCRDRAGIRPEDAFASDEKDVCFVHFFARTIAS